MRSRWAGVRALVEARKVARLPFTASKRARRFM